MKQMNFLEDEKKETKQRKTRVEKGYREVISKDGSISTHICAQVGKRIRDYCRYADVNCTNFVTEAVVEYLDKKEKEIVQMELNKMSRDELEKKYLECLLQLSKQSEK